MPLALVITAPGINCDGELVQAFRLAGAEVESLLLKQLAAEPSLIERFDLIGIPGGFSYGDDIAAGRIVAQLIRQSVYPQLADAIARGTPVITPCNGFQIAVQCGLLPGPVSGGGWPAQPATPVVALADNASARFADRWVRVEIPANTRCIWTRGLGGAEATVDAAHGGRSSSRMMLPIAHGEGRFIAEASLVDLLERQGQIALRYAADDNPNGSMRAIAGICDPTGVVFGLMPHPERFTRFTQHPFWTRFGDDVRSGEPLGLAMFKAAVRAASSRECAVTPAR